MNIKLEKPDVRWKYSYLTLVEEFKFNNEDLIPWVIGKTFEDFNTYLKFLEDASKGLGLKDWQVPHETYWLLVDDEVVGVSNLRLELNDKLKKDGGHIGYGVRPSARRKGYATILLAETLKKARQNGIEKCLVMCDKANIGSAGTILKNGGHLESEGHKKDHDQMVQKYWIDL